MSVVPQVVEEPYELNTSDFRFCVVEGGGGGGVASITYIVNEVGNSDDDDIDGDDDATTLPLYNDKLVSRCSSRFPRRTSSGIP